MTNQRRSGVMFALVMAAALAIFLGTRPAVAAGANGAKTHATAQTTSGDEQLLVTSGADNALAVVNVHDEALRLVKMIQVGKSPKELCVSPDRSRAYVSNRGDNTVSVVDLDAEKTVATIPLPGLESPDGCGVSPDGKKLYVTGQESNNVFVLSADTHQILHQIKVAKEPRRVVFTPDDHIFITSEDGNTISVLDPSTDQIIDTFHSGGHSPRTIIFLPDRKTMLVTNVDDDTVSFMNSATKQVELTIGAGGSPQRLAISRDGQSALVLAVLEQKISIIDLKGPHIRAKRFVRVGNNPYGMVMSRDGSWLCVSNTKDNDIVLYDMNSLLGLPINKTSDLQPRSTLSLKTPWDVALR